MAWEQVLGIDFAMAQKSMREEIPQRGYKVNGGPILLLFFFTHLFFYVIKFHTF